MSALSVGVMGAGAIGTYVGARLQAAGAEVIFVGRPRLAAEFAQHELALFDVNGSEPSVKFAPSDVRFETEPDALASCDVVLVAVKSGATRDVGRTLAKIIAPSAVVVSLQNGVRNADLLREELPDRIVLGGIVSFNVVPGEAGQMRQATTGPLVIEAHDDARVKALAALCEASGMETELSPEIRPMQWAKLVINLNNAISALTDVPTQQLVFDPAYRRILAAVMAEALSVLERAGVRVGKVGPLPVRLFPKMLKLPTPILRVASRLQVEIDPEARSSMWQDLSLRRPTEIDELNGEIVALARKHDPENGAPLNERIVALIREAETAAKGSPALSAAALSSALGL